jgi:hypothetical protein
MSNLHLPPQLLQQPRWARGTQPSESQRQGVSGREGQGQTVKLTENPVTQKKIQQKKIKKMDAAQT